LLPICFFQTATGGRVAVHRQFERAQQFGHVLDLVEDRPQRQRTPAFRPAAGSIPDYVRLPTGHQPVANP